MKKTISVVSVLTMFVLAIFCFVGCSGSYNYPDYDNKSSNDQINSNSSKTPDYHITSISQFYNGMARFQTSNGNYGYIDTNGEVIIEPIYETAQEDFDENAARVSKDGIQMLIDRKGNVLVEFNFSFKAIGSFENGFIWVQTTEETISKNVPVMSYFNEKGEKAFSIQNVSHVEAFGGIGLFCNNITHSESGSSFNQYGYALVMSENGGYSYKLIDTKGNCASFIPNDQYIIGVYGNYITLSKSISALSGDMYYIDYQHKNIINAETISNLGASMIELSDSDVYGNKIYSCTSNLSYPNVDPSVGNNCNMLLLVTKNEVVMSLKDIFPEASSFKAVECSTYNNNTYYTVFIKNQSGVAFYSVFDGNGNVLISPTKEYELGNTYSEKSGYVTNKHYEAYSFHSGLCKAKDPQSGLLGFIDLKGNWVIQPQYSSVTDFSEFGTKSYAVVDNVTIINEKGEVVFTAQSDNP